MYIDPAGRCFHHWKFWEDCPSCARKTTEEKICDAVVDTIIAVKEITTTIGDCFDTVGNCFETLWDAYVHSIELEAERQQQQSFMISDFVTDRFSTPEKTRNTLNGIGYIFDATALYAGSTGNVAVAAVAGAIGLTLNVVAWLIDVANEEA